MDTEQFGLLMEASNYITNTVFSAFEKNGYGSDPTHVVIENKTPFEWEVYDQTGEAIHGTVMSPPQDIKSFQYVYDNLNGDLPDDYHLIEQRNITSWSLKSNNQGTEFVAVFKSKEEIYTLEDDIDLPFGVSSIKKERHLFLVIFTYNDLHRDPHAGAMICTDLTLEAIMKDDGNKKGTGIRNHIRKAGDNNRHTKYVNDGIIRVDHKVGSKKSSKDKIKMNLTPAVYMKVELEFDGDWDSWL